MPDPRAQWTTRELVLWSALALALTPCWIDLASHWRSEPWAGPSALFLALGVLTAARQRTRARARWEGLLLVAAALALMTVATGGGVARFARPAIPVAVFGLARALGRPSPAVALLALWVVPPPSAVVGLPSPEVQQALGSLAAVVTGDPAALRFQAIDAGTPLLACFAGIGWWRAARTEAGLGAALASALRWALLALPAQSLGIAVALVLLATGAPSAARWMLDVWTWPMSLLALGCASRSAGPRPLAVPAAARAGSREMR